MPWPDDMAEEQWGRRMLEGLKQDVAAARGSIGELRKMLLGNGTDEGIFIRMSHLERTDKETLRRLDAIEREIASLGNTLDVVARPGADPDVEKAKWRTWGRIAEVTGLITALAMGVANAMGWL